MEISLEILAERSCRDGPRLGAAVSQFSQLMCKIYGRIDNIAYHCREFLGHCHCRTSRLRSGGGRRGSSGRISRFVDIVLAAVGALMSPAL